MMMWSRKEIRSPGLGTYPNSSYFCFSGLIGVSLPFLSLPCCAFVLLKRSSAFWPCVIPMQSMAMAMERRLAGLSRSAGCFFIFQTSATSFSTDCNFLLVSLISSPNALAANSDPVCSFFFSHINASSAVTTNLCRPSCPAPLSFYSLACLSTWVLVLQNGKPSNSRATFPCLPQNTHVELDLDPIQVHSCIQSCLRARTVSVAFSCMKGSSGKSLSLFWIFWCSWRITIKWSSFSHYLGTLTLPGCGDQQVLGNFHSDLLPLQTNEITLNSSVSCTTMELISFMGSYQFKADCFVLIISRSHVIFFWVVLACSYHAFTARMLPEGLRIVS